MTPSRIGAGARAMWLVVPALEHVPSYVDALNRGGSPDNIRGRAAALDELAEIEKDRQAFVARLLDREAKGAPVKLPDGSTRPRLPGYRLWMWDGEFCGSIGLRWQAGTSELPDGVPGHIGYAVVPWKSRRGYGTLALAQMLVNARAEGLAYVEITTDPDNAGRGVSSRQTAGYSSSDFASRTTTAARNDCDIASNCDETKRGRGSCFLTGRNAARRTRMDAPIQGKPMRGGS